MLWTVAFLESVDPSALDGTADKEVTLKFGKMGVTLSGEDYIQKFVLPNFYFHVTAAYAILRHCGVDIGKRDFLGAIPLRMS